ncbi:MAG: Spy/CpxP family protein refolding chaperone [Planctomycetia bacterium]|nr:Spy/CpxP family protein refolding chaperone [Planctomycetia bacterium]
MGLRIVKSEIPVVAEYCNRETRRRPEMLRVCHIIASWGLVILLSATGRSQVDKPVPPTYWHIRAGLIGYIQVKEELKLSDDQTQKIKGAANTHTKEFWDKLNDPEFPLKQRRKLLDDYWARIRTFAPNEYLNAEQAVRFRQMQLWVLGHKAFNEPDVAKELKLTEPQRNALKTIEGEFSNALYELTLNKDSFGTIQRDKTNETMQEERKQLNDLIAAKEKECRAALTEEQRTRFDQMRGPKFENARATLGAMLTTTFP